MSSFRKRANFIGVIAFVFAFLLAAPLVSSNEANAVVCNDNNTVTANVVVFDTIMIHNRLGAQNPNWFIYALRRDVVQGVGDQNPVGGPPGVAAGDGFPAEWPRACWRPLLWRRGCLDWACDLSKL